MSSPEGQPAAPAKRGVRLALLGCGVLVLASAGFAVLRKGEPPPVAAGAEAQKKRVVIEPGILELEPIVLNLTDPSGARFLRLSLRLVLDQRAIAERASRGLGAAKLRDRMLSILAQKRAAELTRNEGRDQLRAEVQQAAEQLLAEPPFHRAESDPAPARVLDVLFTEFLLQ